MEQQSEFQYPGTTRERPEGAESITKLFIISVSCAFLQAACVVEFRIADFFRKGEQPSVYETALDFPLGELAQDFRLDAAEYADAGVVDFYRIRTNAVDGHSAAGKELRPHLFIGAASVFVETFDAGAMKKRKRLYQKKSKFDEPNADNGGGGSRC